MRNKARCKLCESVVDFVDGELSTCKCGELTLDGHKKFVLCSASIDNFIEIDDEGNEITLTPNEKSNKPTKAELIKMLDEMIDGYERLPTNAMISPVTNYDLAASLMLISSILKTI